MSIKESKSLLFNDVSWSVSLLGERVILLECSKQTTIEKIHECASIIENELGGQVDDLVPAYHSIAVFTSLGIQDLVKRLEGKNLKPTDNLARKSSITKLPICYEYGLDLSEIASTNQLEIAKVIDIHLKGVYRSLFVGFTPGFIYSDGLDPRLCCPRKANPRTRIDAGSVGIGGNQTGIYSLDSPGGWNIVGRIPIKVFDPTKQPPLMISVGQLYSFFSITKEEFDSWES